MSLYYLALTPFVLLAAAPIVLDGDESSIEIKKGQIRIIQGETSAEVKPGEISISSEGSKIHMQGKNIEIQSSDAVVRMKEGTKDSPTNVSIETEHYRMAFTSDSLKITPMQGHAIAEGSETKTDPIDSPVAAESSGTPSKDSHPETGTTPIQKPVLKVPQEGGQTASLTSPEAKKKTENSPTLSPPLAEPKIDLPEIVNIPVVEESNPSKLEEIKAQGAQNEQKVVANPELAKVPVSLEPKNAIVANTQTPVVQKKGPDVEAHSGPVTLKEISIVRWQCGTASCDFGGVRFEEGLFSPCQEKKLCDGLSPYLCKKLTQGDLTKIRSFVADVYGSLDTPLTNVVIPPQDITDGTLQVVVYQSMVGSVCVKGNRWYSAKEILNRVDADPGECLYLKRLERSLAIYNRNPFIRVDAVLRPGGSEGTTDVELVVKDRLPFRPYVGGDNTGVQFTDKPRLYTGFTMGKLWGIDDQFSYQFTTTDHMGEFAAHSANYTMSFPWMAQSCMIYGGWARVRGNLPSTEMRNKGTAWQVSGRYQIPISPFYGTMLEEIYFGYDFKRTNNTFLFGGDAVSNQGADINQFVLGCILDFHTRISKTSLVAEVFGAPWRMTAAQSAARYSQLRFDAKPLYAYGRLRLSHTREIIAGFQFKGLLAGQGTGWNLLPSEEFGLGGYATVRGYEERALNTDSGINASVEFLTPKLRLFSLRKKNDDKEELRFLAFADYGMGIYSVPAPGQKKTEWLMGAGGGVRYNYSTNIVLRCDVGAPFHKAGEGRHGIHVHTGGTLSY